MWSRLRITCEHCLGCIESGLRQYSDSDDDDQQLGVEEERRPLAGLASRSLLSTEVRQHSTITNGGDEQAARGAGEEASRGHTGYGREKKCEITDDSG